MQEIEGDGRSAAGIRRRHDRLLADLRATAEAHGHDPDRLRIVAVTKGHPLAVARAACDAGIVMLGENRVQEAEPKIAALPDAEWHLVGHLQSNKARRAVRAFPVIHSVDSIELLDRLDGLAREEGTSPQLLLQVNVSGEAAKSGMAPNALRSVRAPATAVLVGLMTIAPMHASEDKARAVFARLRVLRDELEHRLGLRLPELSMGMSDDADAAAAEGATMVRIGTAIFGLRP
jgi:PLP dependent protein